MERAAIVGRDELIAVFEDFMLYIAGKLTQALIAPLHVILALLFAAWLVRKRRPKTSGALLLTGIFLVYLVSAPCFSRSLIATLERQYAILPAQELPQADAIVVLGGTTHPLEPPRVEAEEINGARVQRAARLFHAGKAPRIIVSGGVVYQGADGLARTESDDMADLLMAMGVPTSAIVREGASRNTFENSRNTVEILDALHCQTVLLVTSAFHMPRAMALFAHSNKSITPAPSDPRAVGTIDDWRDFFPGPDGLKLTTLAVNEWVGLLGYRLLGKL